MKLTNILNTPDCCSEASDSPALDCKQPTTSLPKNTPVAMLYVPYQSWQNVYEPQVGLPRGTIFQDLDKPFIGERTI